MPGLGLVGTVLSLFIFPLAVWVWKIWKNDLGHIAKRLAIIEKSQERIEKKVDDHINSHAKGEFSKDKE